MSHFSILGLSGSVTRPSRTTALVTRVVDALAERVSADTKVIELVDAAPILFEALTPNRLLPAGLALIEAVETADVLVVGSPVYRGSYTGALKHLFDLTRREPLAGKPVVLVATGGSPHHALMLEHQFKPLFGFFGAHTIPTAIYATEASFTDHRLTDPEIEQRVARAVGEVARLLHGPAVAARVAA